MIDTLKEVADNFCGKPRYAPIYLIVGKRSRKVLGWQSTLEPMHQDPDIEFVLYEPSQADLRQTIRNAHLEATSGRYVDRAIRAQQILEDAMSEWSDE